MMSKDPVKKALTLIEVLVAISIVVLASGALGWKMFGMIAKKRFSSNVERLRSRLMVCRRLALNTQSDWQGNLSYNGKEAQFSSDCMDDTKIAPMPKLNLGLIQVMLNDREVKNLCFNFAASGEVFPLGKLNIRYKDMEPIDWNLADLFFLEEGSKAGPAHPKDW